MTKQLDGFKTALTKLCERSNYPSDISMTDFYAIQKSAILDASLYVLTPKEHNELMKFSSGLKFS